MITKIRVFLLKNRLFKSRKGSRLHLSCRRGFSFAQHERTRVGFSPMLVISQHRSRKGTPP